MVNSLVLVLPYFISFLFSLISNDQWKDSIVISKLLSPWIVGLLIATPFSPLFLVFRKQKQSMFFQILLFIGRISCLFIIGILYADLYLTISIYSFLSYLIWIFITAYLINISGYKIHNFIKDFLLSLFISIILWISLKYFSVF